MTRLSIAEPLSTGFPFPATQKVLPIFDPFAGLNFSDQPAGSPRISLFIKPAKHYFLSQNQPVSVKILSAERVVHSH
jgi:hypothetical protein